jgi:hypothetical protein
MARRPCGGTLLRGPTVAKIGLSLSRTLTNLHQKVTPWFAKEKTNTVAEVKRNILSFHGQSMSGSEQRQSVSWVYETGSSLCRFCDRDSFRGFGQASLSRDTAQPHRTVLSQRRQGTNSTRNANPSLIYHNRCTREIAGRVEEGRTRFAGLVQYAARRPLTQAERETAACNILAKVPEPSPRRSNRFVKIASSVTRILPHEGGFAAQRRVSRGFSRKYFPQRPQAVNSQRWK